MSIYDELGVQKLVNAAGTYTIIGGSKMSEGTIRAMKEASESHVEIRKLQSIVHKKLAEITKNEAAYISNGAAAGLFLSVAAAVALKYQKPFYYLSEEEIGKSEVIVFKAHRNPYDWSIKELGVKFREICYANNILPATTTDVLQAINENTVAIYYVASETKGWISDGFLSFDEVVNSVKEKNIPIIVDAAAQLPPLENLWRFNERGAAVTLFSGGKDLKGPQSSGLIVGKKYFVDQIINVGFPNYGIGRMLKVGREEIAGLYNAIKEYINLDHDKFRAWGEEQIKLLDDKLKDSKCFHVERSFPNEAGQPIPRAFIRIKNNIISPEKLRERLMSFEVGIYTMSEGRDGVYINPMTLNDNEISYIIKCFMTIENELIN